MFSRWVLVMVALPALLLGAEARACDGSSPQSVGKEFSKAVSEDSFQRVLACLAPPRKGMLFAYFLLQAGATSKVFVGQGRNLSDIDSSPQTPEGKAFLALVERNGMKLGSYGPDELLGEDASEEQFGLRFLDVAGPDPDRSILALDLFLRETANFALANHLMARLEPAPITEIQVASDTATATMGNQTFELIRYEGSWYVSNPWNLSFRR